VMNSIFFKRGELHLDVNVRAYIQHPLKRANSLLQQVL
jgi:hypothetical protein